MHWHSRPQRPQPSPANPGPYGAHPGGTGQAEHYFANHPQQPPPPSNGPYTLLLRPTTKQPNAPETLTPNDRSSPLFTIHHKPHSFSSHPSLRITQHAAPHTEIGSAQLHHFSSRVDLTPANAAALQYKSGAPLPSTSIPRGETWTWKVDKASSGAQGPYVARLLVITAAEAAQAKRASGFFGVGGKGKKEEGKVMCIVVLEGNLSEAAIELHRKGLERGLFELVVLTAVVQLEELRRKVKGERAGKGGGGGDGGGSN